jgi:hypothetical protein
MTSNLSRYTPRNFERELMLAYDGDVPLPFYLHPPMQSPIVAAYHHPGEIDAALPYASLPHEFLLSRAVSLEELDEMVERRARREELAGR